MNGFLLYKIFLIETLRQSHLNMETLKQNHFSMETLWLHGDSEATSLQHGNIEQLHFSMEQGAISLQYENTQTTLLYAPDALLQDAPNLSGLLLKFS